MGYRFELENESSAPCTEVPEWPMQPLRDPGAAQHTQEKQMDLLAAWHYLQAKFHINEDERGASLVEYALLVALIAVVCIAAITLLGNNAATKFSTVGGSIGAAGS